MKLKKNSILVRWAYLIDNTVNANAASPAVRDSFKMPKTSSVCIIFWRSIFLTPMAILLAVPGAMLGIVVIMVIGAWHIIRDIIIWARRKEAAQRFGYKTDETLGVIGQGFKSFYKKACPLVDIDD